MIAALPAQATQATPAWDNPMGTDGFEFIEYAAPDPRAMGELFERMGFRAIARHRHIGRAIEMQRVISRYTGHAQVH